MYIDSRWGLSNVSIMVLMLLTSGKCFYCYTLKDVFLLCRSAGQQCFSYSLANCLITQSLPSSAATYKKVPLGSCEKLFHIVLFAVVTILNVIPLHFVLLCCISFPIVPSIHNISRSSSVLMMLILCHQ